MELSKRIRIAEWAFGEKDHVVHDSLDEDGAMLECYKLNGEAVIWLDWQEPFTEANHFEALIQVIVDKGIEIKFFESKAFGYFELSFKRKDGTIDVGHGGEPYYNEVTIKVAVLDGDRQTGLLKAVDQLIEKENQ